MKSQRILISHRVVLLKFAPKVYEEVKHATSSVPKYKILPDLTDSLSLMDTKISLSAAVTSVLKT